MNFLAYLNNEKLSKFCNVNLQKIHYLINIDFSFLAIQCRNVFNVKLQ